MKLILLSVSLFCSLALLSASAQEAAKEKTPMEKSMETLDTAFKDLRRALRTPDAAQKEQYGKWVETIKPRPPNARTSCRRKSPPCPPTNRPR